MKNIPIDHTYYSHNLKTLAGMFGGIGQVAKRVLECLEDQTNFSEYSLELTKIMKECQFWVRELNELSTLEEISPSLFKDKCLEGIDKWGQFRNKLGIIATSLGNFDLECPKWGDYQEIISRLPQHLRMSDYIPSKDI